MNRTPFAVALAFALVGAGLLILYKQRLENEIAGGQRVPVLMARRGIALGARLSADDIGVRYLPEAYLDARNVREADTQAIIGVRAGNEIRPNESILWTDLSTTAGQSRKLSSLVRTGMRGVAVPFELAFGGLLRPGDRVDVMMTAVNPVTGRRQTAAFEQNLLVLAVDNDLGQGAGQPGGGHRGGGLATLAVSPDQGQRLTLAQLEGRLSLLLRNPDDLRQLQDQPETRSVDLVLPRPGGIPLGAASSIAAPPLTAEPAREAPVPDTGRARSRPVGRLPGQSPRRPLPGGPSDS